MSNKRVYFVRHGEAEGNTGNFFQFPDSKLTEAGHRGAIAVANRLLHVKADAVVASPFMRAQETARHISDALHIPFTTLDAMHEVQHSAHMRGKKFDSEEGCVYLSNYFDRFCDETWRPEGAENYRDIVLRIEECIGFLEKNPNQNIIVITHGNFLRFLTAYLLLGKEVPNPELFVTVREGFKSMDNVGITEFEYDNGRWRLFTWNDHAHFAE